MFESESRDIGFRDCSLKTLLVLTHRRIFRTCHARVLGGFQQSSSPYCCVLQQFPSNRAWAAVLATTAVLRASHGIRHLQRPRERFRPTALDFSRSPVHPPCTWLYNTYGNVTPWCIRQQVRHLSLLRRSSSLAVAIKPDSSARVDLISCFLNNRLCLDPLMSPVPESSSFSDAR